MEEIKSTDEINYNPSKFRKPQNVADLGRECVALHHIFGVDANKKRNLYLIDNDKIVYAAANSVVFESITGGNKEYLLGIDEGGVGCVAVHPSKKIFAVGGNGLKPNIYIYSYPEMTIKKVLVGGAENCYACLSFDSTGDKLASVSTSPDFMLTIWEWKIEQMGLHSKAFGQDVLNVRFSLDDPRRLTTSGIGHIRFWKMAATFTGLKLQGSIGKFGKIDLSDIDNFVELPDGKVVSGTESGSLLLWEGNFIKCRFVQAGGRLCHEGNITYVELDRSEKCIITAGIDGYIRWWNFSVIDSAEVDSDHSMDFELIPITEYFIGKDIGIKCMIDSERNGSSRFFVILDTKGNMQTISFSLGSTTNRLSSGLVLFHEQKLLSANQNEEQDKLNGFNVLQKNFNKFHASSITGMDTCPNDHLVATCSADGSVRCMNYLNKTEVAIKSFNTAATCLKWLPLSLDSSGKYIVVGFADGVIRILGIGGRGSDGNFSLIRKMAFKPHNAPVLDLCFSTDGTALATSGKDGIIFFFACCCSVSNSDDSTDFLLDKIIPVKFCTIASNANNTVDNATYKNIVSCERLTFKPNGSTILCTCNDGLLRELDVSELKTLISDANVNMDNEIVSYEVFFPIREINTKYSVVIPSKNTAVNTITTTNNATQIATEEKVGESIDNANNAANNTVAAVAVAAIVTQSVPLKNNCAIYSLNREMESFITSSYATQKNYCFEFDCKDTENPLKELVNGLYSADGKEFLKNPSCNVLRYSWSNNFLISGLNDGSVVIRPRKYLETFARSIGHNNACDGVSSVASSFDDRFLLSSGKDSTLSVHRVRLDIINDKSLSLYKDLEANVFGDDKIKPLPKTIPNEYKYQNFISNTLHNKEKVLFEYNRNSSVEDETNILLKKLLNIAEETDDISSNAYSIQDNRLKLEENARKESAEELKNRVRGSIAVLQKDFEKILFENEIIPEFARLTPDELLVDGDYFNALIEEGNTMVEEVHKECAYDAEKSFKLRTKIASRLMDGLLTEEIPLFGLVFDKRDKRQAKVVVKSFRARSLDTKVMSILADINLLVRETELKEAQARTNESAQKKALEAVDEMKLRLLKKEEDHALNVSSKFDVNNALANTTTNIVTTHVEQQQPTSDSSVVVRRFKRKERKEGLKRHLTEKPNVDEDDTRDLNAIKIAEKTIGAYKLKCADDYEVPSDQRINAVKKLRQMAMLEESMLTMRLQFNEKFFSLRDIKKNMIFSIKLSNSRIRAIDDELQQSFLSDTLWEPSFDAQEFPDDDDEITEEELNRFKNQRTNFSWEKSIAPPQTAVTGLKTKITRNPKTSALEVIVKKRDDLLTPPSNTTTVDSSGNKAPLNNDNKSNQQILITNLLCNENSSFDNNSDDKNGSITADNADEQKSDNSIKEEEPKYYEAGNSLFPMNTKYNIIKKNELKRLHELETLVPILVAAREAIKERMQVHEANALQEKHNKERKLKLEFERNMILKKIEENVIVFNSAIDELRVDRHLILSNLKLTEMKLLILFQEYKLLLTFEGKDNLLQQKQVRIKGEEREIIATANDNKSKLLAKQEEMQHWSQKSTQIFAEFKLLIPDSHTYAEQLFKIFKKKVKRNHGGDMEDDDEDYDDDGEDNDGDDDDDEEVEDICPPGCDPNLYDRVIDAREKKVDIEEMITDLQRGIEDLKKTIERSKQREKQIVKDSLQTELEVQQFQLQKQIALNQITVVVPLKISQIFMFETSGVLTGPTDKSIVTTENNEENIEKIQILKDAERRSLVQNVDLKSHALFTNRNLKRLKDRINELHVEIDESRESFKLLQKERGSLMKDRDNKALEIEAWRGKCEELQMLKFGKVIDLDELEFSSDRTKESEAEALLKDDETVFRLKTSQLTKESAVLQEQLALATNQNTKLLNEVAEIIEMKLEITRDLNASTTKTLTLTNKTDSVQEVEETRRIKAYIKLQAKELDSLRTELNMLKRKEAPTVTIPNIPSITPQTTASHNYEYSNNNNSKTPENVLKLPPIPNNRK